MSKLKLKQKTERVRHTIYVQPQALKSLKEKAKKLNHKPQLLWDSLIDFYVKQKD